MSGIYQVTSDDINQLMKQTVINEEHARELLLKNHGDIVQCILDNCNITENTITVHHHTNTWLNDYIKTLAIFYSKIRR